MPPLFGAFDSTQMEAMSLSLKHEGRASAPFLCLPTEASKTPDTQLGLGVNAHEADQARWICQGSPPPPPPPCLAHVETTDPYLRSEHVQDAINRPSQQQPPNQEAGQHHVGEEGAEIHDLQRRQRPLSGRAPPAAGTPLPGSQLGPMILL